MKKIKLFCFPYAGGSSVVYDKWKKHLSHSIELIPIEYPGRGRKFTAPLCENINEIVADAFDSVKNHLDGSSFSFLGHSMGALIAYELSHKLKQLNYVAPVHIFFSGRLAPHIMNPYKNLHVLNNMEFKEELLKLGGTPLDALENKDWLRIFLPIIRSDFKAVELYNYSKENSILDSEFTILYGEDDYLINDKIREWHQHTEKKCTFLKFSGGHFFITDNVTEIASIINNTLTSNL